MDNKISWTSVKTLLRLDLRSRFGSKAERRKRDRAMIVVNAIFTLAVYAVLVMGIYFLTKMFVDRSDLRLEFLVMATTLTIGISTLVAIGNVVKNLYMNGDNELLLRFPVSGKEILIAKSIYCFMHTLIINFMLMMPFYVVYGVVTSAGAGFYFAAIGIALMSTFLPYFIANLLAIPVMIFINAVKNQFLIVLIFLIGAICACFILYMETLSGVLNYLSTENVNIFSPAVLEKYQIFAANAYPFNWYAYLLNGKLYGDFGGKDLGLFFLYVFLINAVLGVGAFFVASKGYYRTILKGIETEKVSFSRKTKNVKRTVFGTLLRREFYNIFRSFNYSFQYLAMAVAAPVMVYYCNSLASSMGQKSVGSLIVPGLTLLVVIIFVAIIVSFASTTISREGGAFYHTKVVPVSYTNQILVKLFLYAMVATISVALCCTVVGSTFGTASFGKVLTSLDLGAIFGISEMTVLSLTCLSIWADVKSPTFNVSGDGEIVKANKNVAVSLFTGIMVAVVFGVFSMIFSFLPLSIGGWQVISSIKDVYAILAVVSALLLIVSVTLLFAKLEKRYQKITP